MQVRKRPIHRLFTPEYVTVQPDGYISASSHWGDMHAEGMTLLELTNVLRTAYSKILHDPIITVALSTLSSRISSWAARKIRSARRHHVDQAMEIAGGFTYTQSHELLFRRVSDDWVSAGVINVKKMSSADSLAEDPQVDAHCPCGSASSGRETGTVLHGVAAPADFDSFASARLRRPPDTSSAACGWLDTKVRALLGSGALSAVASLSGDIPRNINNICFNARSQWAEAYRLRDSAGSRRRSQS